MEEIKKEGLSVPVCLMFFLRYDKLPLILDVIRKARPSRMFLLSDGPRNDGEQEAVNKARQVVEKSIDWDCRVTKIYHEKNVGVYENIAGGAKEVFSQVESAIFLEDDNLPSLSFFSYCQFLLNKYRDNQKVLWICGTNYLTKPHAGKDTFYFTQHLLPCGWASWSKKFLQYYDGMLLSFSDKEKHALFKKSYHSKLLYISQQIALRNEIQYISTHGYPHSWDYQMLYVVRSNGLYGIAPSQNLIQNIGVDIAATHGGSTWKNPMTKRFCGIPQKELSFPLKPPLLIAKDPVFEKEIGKVLTPPVWMLFKAFIFSYLIRKKTRK